MLGLEGAFDEVRRSPRSSGHSIPVGLYVYCDAVDEIYHHAVANGAESTEEPKEVFWGDKICTLVDPTGTPGPSRLSLISPPEANLRNLFKS